MINIYQDLLLKMDRSLWSIRKKLQCQQGNRIKASMLRLNLCDYYDAFIVVKWNIAVTAPNNTKRNNSVAFQNNALFISCISKTNGVYV